MSTRLLDTVESSEGFVFSKLTSAPWYTSNAAADLDLDYLYNHSGGKIVSPLVRALLEDGVLSDSAITSLARIIWTKYAAKWDGLWATITAFQTDPYHDDSYMDIVAGSDIKEYIGAEESTIDHPIDSPRTTRRNVVGGWTDTDNTSVVTTGKEITTEKGDTLTGVYGFNSSSPVNANKVGPADSNGLTTELSYGTGATGDPGLTRQNAGAITRQYGAGDTPYQESVVESGQVKTTKDFNNRKDKTKRNDTVTHTGNKRPVAETLASMLESLDYKDFFETVYSDIDSVLTLRLWF